MFILIFETARGVYWEKTVIENTPTHTIMSRAFESHEQKQAITAVYLIFLEYEVSDEQMNTIVTSPFEEGATHEHLWHDVDYVDTNLIGFDPDRHVFLCHKCGGKLAGNHEMKRCRCISGWIRPFYRYIEVSEL